MGDGRVVGAREGEHPSAGCQRSKHPDDAAVRENRNALVRVVRRDLRHGCPDSCRQVDLLLGARDHVPRLLGLHPLPVGVVLGRPDRGRSPPSHSPRNTSRRSGSTTGMSPVRSPAGPPFESALEVRDVDCRERQSRQPFGDEQGLVVADRVQRRVTVPGHQAAAARPLAAAPTRRAAQGRRGSPRGQA